MTEGGAPATRRAGDAEGTDAPAAESPAELARRAQFLATEHYSLLATRTMSWNESFSRTAMFLSTLSAATVALALAGPAMAFGSAFALFALIVLSVTLFLGLATFVRLIQVNHEDLYWTFGMNRLRAAYARMAPGIERDFIAGWTTDANGLARTYGAVDVVTPSPLHALVTTPAVVAVISSAIAGVIGGLLAVQFGRDMPVALAIGIAVFVGSGLALTRYGVREYGRYVERIGRQYGIKLSANADAGD